MTLPEPIMLTREGAARLCGVSRKTFDRLVALGTYPAGVTVPGMARQYWHRGALQARLDTIAGLGAKSYNDWSAEKAEWQRHRQKTAGRRVG